MPVPNPVTHPQPPIAGLVVWRHPCDCATASRPLEPGEEPEHRFDVDGAEFPWHITEGGARFAKRGGVYLVEVDIVPLERGGNNEMLDVTLGYWRRQPRIGERAFPWAILSGSVRVEMLDDSFPLLHLTFLAEQVDADVEVPELDDEAPDDGYHRYLDRLAAGTSAGECWDGADA